MFTAIVKPNKYKRYNLAIPESLYREVQSLAKDRSTTSTELIRKYIKLGLVVTQNPNAVLILREGETERELVMI